MIDTESVPAALSRYFPPLLDAAPMLIWVAGPSGEFEQFNQRWLDYTGQTRDQASKWGVRAALHPSDLKPTTDAWLRCVSEGIEFEREYQLRRASDGAYRWHLGRAVPVRSASAQIDYWIGISVDVTDLKRAESNAVGMLDRAIDCAARKQTFLCAVMAGMTEGRVRLCDSVIDLPPMRTQLVRGIALTPDTFARIRQEVRDVADHLGFSRERSLDLLAAVGEATMNALVHCGGGTVRVHTDDTQTLQVWIEDAGAEHGAEVTPQRRRSVTRDRSHAQSGAGHGFHIMSRTVDRLWLLTEQDGTTVVLEQDVDDSRDGLE